MINKIAFALILLSVTSNVFAQDNLPTINATSEIVDIRVGDDFFLKGGWHLDPETNPDVFSIGSKWIYSNKEVTFITDIDSISFYVDPGNTYDFIVIFNETTPCHIQIATMANPVFMNEKAMIAILSVLLIASILFYGFQKKIKLKYLLYCGFVSPILFWITTIISGYIHGDYVHYVDTISELGAIGTNSELFTSSSFIFLSILCLWFSFAFYKASQKLNLSVIPALFTFSMPLTLLWAAVFTLGNEFHSLVGPITLLMILGPLLAFLLWPKEDRFLRIRMFSLAGFFLMMLLTLRFLEPFEINYEGLVQRFFYVGWSVWFMSVSYYLVELLKMNSRKIE